MVAAAVEAELEAVLVPVEESPAAELEAEAGADVTEEEEPEEAVAVPVEEAVAAPDFKLGVCPAAQVAVVGRASAAPTEPQIPFANSMVAVDEGMWVSRELTKDHQVL